MFEERWYSDEELVYQASKDIHHTVSPFVLSAAKAVDNVSRCSLFQFFREEDRHDSLPLAWSPRNPQQGVDTVLGHPRLVACMLYNPLAGPRNSLSFGSGENFSVNVWISNVERSLARLELLSPQICCILTLALIYARHQEQYLENFYWFRRSRYHETLRRH
jgi:hypothetical protein